MGVKGALVGYGAGLCANRGRELANRAGRLESDPCNARPLRVRKETCARDLDRDCVAAGEAIEPFDQSR